MNLSLRQLQYFVAVVRTGNITQAAEVLHVAPTALSLQIKAIEDRFGTLLLVRHSRGVAPTEAGRALCTQAERILGLVEEAERALKAPAPAAGPTIRLGVQPALARLIGYDAVVGIGKQIAGATLRASEGWTADLERRLDAGELDAVVGYGLNDAPSRKVTDIMEDRLLYVTAAAAGEAAGEVQLGDVLARPLVFYGEKSLSWRAATAAARDAGLVIKSHTHVESAEIWREMLIRGSGAALASYASVAHEHARGEVVVREVSDHVFRAMIRLSLRIEVAAEPWAPPFADFVRLLVRRAYPPGAISRPVGHEDAL
jgi:LysR family nitrogen assimilation transcriptional regulator